MPYLQPQTTDQRRERLGRKILELIGEHPDNIFPDRHPAKGLAINTLETLRTFGYRVAEHETDKGERLKVVTDQLGRALGSARSLTMKVVQDAIDEFLPDDEDDTDSDSSQQRQKPTKRMIDALAEEDDQPAPATKKARITIPKPVTNKTVQTADHPSTTPASAKAPVPTIMITRASDVAKANSSNSSNGITPNTVRNARIDPRYLAPPNGTSRSSPGRTHAVTRNTPFNNITATPASTPDSATSAANANLAVPNLTQSRTSPPRLSATPPSAGPQIPAQNKAEMSMTKNITMASGYLGIPVLALESELFNYATSLQISQSDLFHHRMNLSQAESSLRRFEADQRLADAITTPASADLMSELTTSLTDLSTQATKLTYLEHISNLTPAGPPSSPTPSASAPTAGPLDQALAHQRSVRDEAAAKVSELEKRIKEETMTTARGFELQNKVNLLRKKVLVAQELVKTCKDDVDTAKKKIDDWKALTDIVKGGLNGINKLRDEGWKGSKEADGSANQGDGRAGDTSPTTWNSLGTATTGVSMRRFDVQLRRVRKDAGNEGGVGRNGDSSDDVRETHSQ